MRKLLIYILILNIGLLQLACNTEEGLEPVTPKNYFKILEGRGTDNPIAIRSLSDGNLLIVSNTTSFEQGEQIRKIRVLKIDLNGNVLNERYLPENNENWSAKDVLKLTNDEIVIASTSINSIAEDSSLVFYKINSNLDSLSATTHHNSATYNLYGVAEDQNELLFIAQEFKDQTSYPIIGRIDLSSSNIIDIKSAEKYDVPPATKVYRNAVGEYIWAYNRTRSYLAKVQPNLLQVNDQEIHIGNNLSSSVKAEKLLMINMNPIVFGELTQNGNNQLFYYSQESGSSFVFGESGDVFLNNVQKTESGYLVTGFQSLQIDGSENRQTNFYFSRRNANGGEIFSKAFGTNENEELMDALMINDGIYTIGKTIFGGENTLILIKTDAFGRLQ
ncbi:immunoglobulin domain-containing family protein [Marivirga arenosa]|uniref:Uncharacterized protein n=1 Tax=Marivirga arenosa TaxID=3059076 RepID=A0AA52EWQ0_9BACT|nr:hypothetical protein [Marivirga sp. BKB1-2]WNB18065.1 hypothetical protein QYS47_29085 [Marivirga sp. BKB1-2]